MKLFKKKAKLVWNPIHPKRDWQILVITSFVLILCIILWSGYIFYSSKKVESPGDGIVSGQSDISKRIEKIDLKR